MRFEVYSELVYQTNTYCTFIFNIQVSRSPIQTIIKESLVIDPKLPYEELLAHDGETRFIKVEVVGNITFRITYKAEVEVINNVEKKYLDLRSSKFNSEIITYLFPSRYCQSDKLQRLAISEFGNLGSDYAKANAINEWIYHNVTYLSGSTDSSTSAYDTISERAGVCRDFAHLGIALCRALTIPARYFTGYAHELQPPDFHACFEVQIGGEWMLFDPTKLAPVNGLVKIGNGRDAADVAVANIFGSTECLSMDVRCRSLNTEFSPVY